VHKYVRIFLSFELVFEIRFKSI